MLGVKPYISFNGNCEEAMNFYKEVFGADLLFMQKVGDSPMKDMGPADAVMHCRLQIGETQLMASDNMGRPMTMGDNITLAVGLDDLDKAQAMFDRLADGGSITMPIQPTYWAAGFGMLVDSFGINWMFDVESPESSN